MTSFGLGPSGSLAMSPTGDKHLDSLLALVDEVSSLEDSTLTLSAIELSPGELLLSSWALEVYLRIQCPNIPKLVIISANHESTWLWGGWWIPIP